MSENPPKIPFDRCLLTIAGCAAIRAWLCNEGHLAKKLQNPSTRIDPQFLSRWLGLWMLARSNPVIYRDKLAKTLEVIRPALFEASASNLPGLVDGFAQHLKLSNATRGIQTSLVSKFAFSLRPEVIVPYDKTARSALSKIFNTKIIY